MIAADYPRAVGIGRGRDRITVRMRRNRGAERDGLLLLKFQEPDDARIDTLVSATFEGPVAGAAPRALAGRARGGGAARPSPGEIIRQRLLGRSMRLVATPRGRAARETVRGFLRDNTGNAILASPVYQPTADLDLMAAVSPMTTMFVVRLREGQDPAAMRRIEALGLRRDDYFSAPDGAGSLERFRLDLTARDPETRELRIPDDGFGMLGRIGAVPGVDLVEHDWIALDPLEDAAGTDWSAQELGIAAARRRLRGARTVRVAVIDTGFELHHPALEQAWTEQGGASFPGTACHVPDEIDPGVPPVAPRGGAEEDVRWHGTAVAGILAGQLMGTAGIEGVAPDCELLPVRVTKFSDSNIAAALRYATSRDVHVVNISLRCGTPHHSLEAAVREAWDKRVVICAAAGNAAPDERPRVVYPAAFREVIAVGASVPGGEPKSLGDGEAVGDPGDDWYSNYGPALDVLAPGVRIRTTDLLGGLGRDAGAGGAGASDDYTSFDGTSAAAPYVSGLAALLLGELTEDEWEADDRGERVRELIESTCRRVGGPDSYPFGTPDKPRSLERGYGIINPEEALATLASSHAA